MFIYVQTISDRVFYRPRDKFFFFNNYLLTIQEREDSGTFPDMFTPRDFMYQVITVPYGRTQTIHNNFPSPFQFLIYTRNVGGLLLIW